MPEQKTLSIEVPFYDTYDEMAFASLKLGGEQTRHTVFTVHHDDGTGDGADFLQRGEHFVNRWGFIIIPDGLKLGNTAPEPDEEGGD